MAASACHRGVPPSNEPEKETQGVFEYEATALNQVLRGRIVISDTIVVVDPVDDECWRLPETFYREGPHHVTFACAGTPTTAGATSPQGTTRLRISLLRPTRDSQWGRLTQLPATARECTATTMGRGGRICTAYVDRRVYTNRWQWGNLHVKRAYLSAPDTTGRELPQ